MVLRPGTKGTGLDKLNEEQRRIIVQQLVAPLHVSMLDGEPRRGILAANAWTPKMPPDDIVEAFVDPWCDRLEQRQSFYLETLTVVYADPSSAAFQHSPKLRDKLKQMRALLLEHPARHQVDLRDVIDPSYRAKLFDATVGDQPRRPPARRRCPRACRTASPSPSRRSPRWAGRRSSAAAAARARAAVPAGSSSGWARSVWCGPSGGSRSAVVEQSVTRSQKNASS